jgi:hypothetical protein
MTNYNPFIIVATMLGLSLSSTSAFTSALDRKVTKKDFVEPKVYSPYAGRAYADQVFFGDTHFHTNCPSMRVLSALLWTRMMAFAWRAARQSPPTLVSRCS